MCEGLLRHPNIHPRNPETFKVIVTQIALEVASIHKTSLDYARTTGSEGNYLSYLATLIPGSHQDAYFQLLAASPESASEADIRMWRSKILQQMKQLLLQLIEIFKAPPQNKLT